MGSEFSNTELASSMIAFVVGMKKQNKSLGNILHQIIKGKWDLKHGCISNVIAWTNVQQRSNHRAFTMIHEWRDLGSTMRCMWAMCVTRACLTKNTFKLNSSWVIVSHADTKTKANFHESSIAISLGICHYLDGQIKWKWMRIQHSWPRSLRPRLGFSIFWRIPSYLFWYFVSESIKHGVIAYWSTCSLALFFKELERWSTSNGSDHALDQRLGAARQDSFTIGLMSAIPSGQVRIIGMMITNDRSRHLCLHNVEGHLWERSSPIRTHRWILRIWTVTSHLLRWTEQSHSHLWPHW